MTLTMPKSTSEFEGDEDDGGGASVTARSEENQGIL
jgi:hypothetical protein